MPRKVSKAIAARKRNGAAHKAFARFLICPEGMRPPTWRWIVLKVGSEDNSAGTLKDAWISKAYASTTVKMCRPEHVHFLQAHEMFVRGSLPFGRRWIIEALIAGGASDEEIAQHLGDVLPETVGMYVAMFHDVRGSLGNRTQYEARVRPVGGGAHATSGATMCDMVWKMFSFDWGWTVWAKMHESGVDALDAEQRQWFDRMVSDMRSEALSHASLSHDASSENVLNIVNTFSGRASLGLTDLMDGAASWFLQEAAPMFRRLNAVPPKLLNEGDGSKGSREEIPEAVVNAAVVDAESRTEVGE